jgi:hypothetical protein
MVKNTFKKINPNKTLANLNIAESYDPLESVTNK